MLGNLFCYMSNTEFWDIITRGMGLHTPTLVYLAVAIVMYIIINLYALRITFFA